MQTHKCCFIGHREIMETEELKNKLRCIVEDLIVKCDVTIFLFGSRSQFNDLCYNVVRDLQLKYTHIKKVVYTCRSQGCYLESERERWESFYLRVYKKEVSLQAFDKEYEHKTKYTAGKAGYIERNRAMINDSDYCVLYYDKTYKPKQRKLSKRNVTLYQPKSGTKLAYDYAIRTKKKIINICE